MEYLQATGAWMNEINRCIDDVVVKAGIRGRGRWQVSSMDWPRYFQVVGKSDKGLVGFVGDSASGTCEVLCQHVGQAHAVPTVSVEEIAECLDMPPEWASIAITGMTAVVERGHAALSHYDGWTLVETSEGRLLPGLMTQRGTMVDIDRAIRAGCLGLGKAAYTVHCDGDGVWAQPVDGGGRIELERTDTRWGSYVVLPGAETVTEEVHYAAWAAWSAQEPALGRVGPRENKDVYEWADNDFGAGGADVRVAYLDAVPYVWVDRACIIRLVEGNVGIVELVRPCGEVWREGLWETVTRRLTEEDERVLDEVNRQRRAHAAASSSLVETS